MKRLVIIACAALALMVIPAEPTRLGLAKDVFWIAVILTCLMRMVRSIAASR